MNLGLKNKVALVTGGSKGIGKAIALALAREGVQVAICGRTQSALHKTILEIEKNGSYGLSIAADVTKASDIKKVIQRIIKQWGRLDIVVNNAGGASKFGDFHSLTVQDWQSCYELNVISAVKVCQESLKYLRLSPSPRIINIASIVGLKPGLYNPHYAAAKAAMINVSQHLAKILAKDKILVNVICAGPVHSEAWERNLAYVAKLRNKSLSAARAEFETQEAAKVPLGRVGEGKDVASLVVFLSSEESVWTTGSCFQVDGGKGNQ